MNIRVDLNTPIKDGTEVVFRSPVDCSQITGLIVYFTDNGITASQEFALADAHGNNVGDIDHLFAENVVVKVILDVTKGMAFVQNADTNAYLEGRFDGKADGVPYSKSALVVQTYPVAGTKVKVSASLPSGATHLKLYCTGKKLFNAVWDKQSTDTMDEGYIGYKSPGGTANSGTSLRSRYVPVSHLVGKVLNIAGAYVGGSNPGYAFYNSDQSYLSGNNTGTAFVPAGAAWMRFTVLKTNVTVNGKLDLNLIQLETGLQSDTEEYKELVFEPVTGDISLERELLTGYNTIYAYAGTVDGGVFKPTVAVPVTVVCLENPVAETWRLKESIAQFHI